jgi:hypothetical protein
MKSIIFGLAFISAAVAQSVNGASSVPASSEASGSASGSSSQATSTQATSSQASSSGSNNYGGGGGSSYGGSPPAYTGSPSSEAAPSQYTPPPPASMSAMYSQQQQYYSSFMSGGYKSMDCGYGYSKDSDGGCSSPMSWVSSMLVLFGLHLRCSFVSTQRVAQKGVTKPLSLTTVVEVMAVDTVVDMVADLAIQRLSLKRSIRLSPR